MKRIILFAIAFVFLFQAGAMAESKIGVFNMRTILTDCDYGKSIAAQLKAKFEPMEKDLEREGESIQKLEDELKTQDMALKLEAKQDKQREYRRKARDYQDSVVAYRQKRQTEEQRLVQPVVVKVVKVMTEYGKKNNFTMILEMSTGGVSYVGDGVDITQNLIDELNKLKKTEK